MTHEILGKGRRRRFNPDLAKRLNEEHEREKKKDRLKPIKKEIPEESGGIYQIVEEMINNAIGGKSEVLPVKGERIKAIGDIFKRYMRSPLNAVAYLEKRHLAKGYAREISKNLAPFNRSEIELFGERLANSRNIPHDTFGWAASNFLNILMVEGAGDYFVLNLEQLNLKNNVFLNYVASHQHKKEIVILGDVGERLGDETKDSIIVVRGNVKGELGESKNCKYFIEHEYSFIGDLNSFDRSNKVYKRIIGSKKSPKYNENKGWFEVFPRDK